MLTQEQIIDRICDIKRIAEDLDSEDLWNLHYYFRTEAKKKSMEESKQIAEQLNEDRLNNPPYQGE